MTSVLTVEDLASALRRVAQGRYGGKPLFFWQSGEPELGNLIAQSPDLGKGTAWLDVNELAEDVIPRMARQRLIDRLAVRLKELIARECKLLVVVNPQLILRYESAAPLAPFWNGFVSSRRAVVIVLPPAVARPLELPDYVKYRGDVPAQLFGDVMGVPLVPSPAGGLI